MLEGMFACVSNVSFDPEAIAALERRVRAKAIALGEFDLYDMGELWDAQEDIRSLKSLLLFGMRGVAAYAYHAQVLGKSDPAVTAFLYEGMRAVGSDLGMDELLPLVLKCGEVNLAAMAALEDANISAYGKPEPATVELKVEAGPFIVVTGHDLHDLKQLLEQTEGRGVNVYTHGEMLPAHAYPELQQVSAPEGQLRYRMAEPAQGIQGPARADPVDYQLPACHRTSRTPTACSPPALVSLPRVRMSSRRAKTATKDFSARYR